jgi:hypothetical protein
MPVAPAEIKNLFQNEQIFVLTFVATILLVSNCLLGTILLFEPPYIKNRGIEVDVHHRTREVLKV